MKKIRANSRPRTNEQRGGGSNRWATMSRARKPVKPGDQSKRKPASKRRALDDYETPGDATRALKPFLALQGVILEPCAGSGRMARELRTMYPGASVASSDIKRGADFLTRVKPHTGPCVTNPPYRDGQAEAIARHALKLCSGPVAMLMQSGFVWGQRRADGLFLAGLRPSKVIVIPWRIMFIDGDGNEIEGQFFSHCWVVWPSRPLRERNAKTEIEWAVQESAAA